MKHIKSLILVFLLWTAIGAVSKLLFLVCYHAMIGGVGLTDTLLVIWHGLILDTAIAGYLSIIPALLLIVMLWYDGRLMKWIWNGYFILTSCLVSMAYVANLVLYGYWSYPLDNTPLLYIKTSPADAMASASIWQVILAFVIIAALTAAMAWCFARLLPKKSGKRLLSAIALLLMAGLMIIPIRGGFGTGTNHTGTVYFSDNIRLNHAAVNPVFSFLESVNHQQNIGAMYRFMDDKTATAIVSPLVYTSLRSDTTAYLTTNRPNIVIIMLESFSRYIMSDKGHVTGVVPCLEALTKQGMYFTHCYANSFRTDRAMVAIQSGFPAQPSMSIMDIPHKSTTLPSLARTLDHYGYTTTFYYGGDTNYSNMRSYYVGTGYHNIVSEYEFPARQRTCKWGVPDGDVYSRMLSDIRKFDSSKGAKDSRFLFSMMTESSHEPFDVPYKSKLTHEALNAFAYADKCLGDFIDGMKKLPSWNNTIVVIVPDHLGAYPDDIDNYAIWRYELPLIIMGGAVKQNMDIDTECCQKDIPATLLGMMGIDHSDFHYSIDALDSHAPHYAFIAPENGVAMVRNGSYVFYDDISKRIINHYGSSTDLLLRSGKAYLQKLYDDIDER